jgi:hypothetical protein
MELDIDASEAERIATAFSGTQPLLDAELLTAMTRSTAQLHGDVVAATPVWQGTARRSTTKTATPREGKVGTNLVHGIVQQETGRRAGAAAPPVAAIMPWVTSKGMPAEAAFVVARAIGRRGIPARRLYTNAVARHRGAIQAEFNNAVQRFIAKLQARL